MSDEETTRQERASTGASTTQNQHQRCRSQQKQLFEVTVPPNIQPNHPFQIIVCGHRITVKCPPNVCPGQKIRFQLPATRIKLSYDNERCWTRAIRGTDMKFHWVCKESKETIDRNERFDIDHSAFVRRFDFLEGNDQRIGTGHLCFVPATSEDAFVDSAVTDKNEEVASCADIITFQGKSYQEKTKWFQEKCSQLSNDGCFCLLIRRASLLHDSLHAIINMKPDDLRSNWQVQFIGESGINEGCIETQEWFHLVAEQFFDESNGLWLTSSMDEMRMVINPSSKISRPGDYLVYFRSIGRFMGKALFDHQRVERHVDVHIYKHILGWPVTFADLKDVDDDHYNNLCTLSEIDDVSMLCLDFATVEDTPGGKEIVEFLPNGQDIDVTNENLPEYLEAELKYYLLDRTNPQLSELLLGFFEVVPEPLLIIFDVKELKMLMHGQPVSDSALDDWEANTVYPGFDDNNGEADPVCRWFWEVVREFDQTRRLKLVHYFTGILGVPSRGLSRLQGNDGQPHPAFSLRVVGLTECPDIRVYREFNRVELPNYESKERLLSRLNMLVDLF